MSDTTNVDLSRVENLLSDLVKSLGEQSSVDTNAELIAKGADAIVADAKASNEAIIKSLVELRAAVDAIAGALTSLSAEVSSNKAEISKSLADIASTPVAPRSVQTVVASAPVAPEVNKQDIIAKAMVELQTAIGDRKLQLLNGIAKLDTNYAPAEIAAELNLR